MSQQVFSQTNLSSYIREIEEALEDPHFMHRSLIGGTSNALGQNGLGAGIHSDHFPARSLASVARAHFVEMEGPSHSYQPMYSSGNIAMVRFKKNILKNPFHAMMLNNISTFFRNCSSFINRGKSPSQISIV